MALKAGFIFLAPGAEGTRDRAWVKTPAVELLAVGTENYESAVQVAQDMEREGIKAIELCGGFGILGTAEIKKAVSKDVAVGVVHFDRHPGLENQSGDDIF